MLEQGFIEIVKEKFDVVPGLLDNSISVRVKEINIIKEDAIASKLIGENLVIIGLHEKADPDDLKQTSSVAVSTDLGGKAIPIMIRNLNIVLSGVVVSNSTEQVLNAIRERYNQAKVVAQEAA